VVKRRREIKEDERDDEETDTHDGLDVAVSDGRRDEERGRDEGGE
jgi:hypothetical protein